jgi:hypothetical protein
LLLLPSQFGTRRYVQQDHLNNFHLADAEYRLAQEI